MDVRRTVPGKLAVTEDDEDLLHETIDRFRDAAKNVGFNLLLRLHTSSDGDAPVGVHMNAGTMTTSGFEHAQDSVSVGAHGESSAL